MEIPRPPATDLRMASRSFMRATMCRAEVRNIIVFPDSGQFPSLVPEPVSRMIKGSLKKISRNQGYRKSHFLFILQVVLVHRGGNYKFISDKKE